MIKLATATFSFALLLGCSADLTVKNPTFNSLISNMALEWAVTPEQKQTGLMNRTFLAENAGMVFDLKDSPTSCFWMENTLIPLSVGFIDENGRLFQIENMQPKSTEIHCPSQPTRYALEVNQGWFDRHQIAVGALLITDNNLRNKNEEQSFTRVSLAKRYYDGNE